MDSSLRERFGRLGPIRGIDRVASGSSAVFVLSLTEGTTPPRTIDGMLALARRGIPMLRAKRAIESLVEHGRVFIDLPIVESPAALIDDLDNAGISATRVGPTEAIDVRCLRERLGFTREQFAARFGLEVETLRNWEIGKREPDTTARSYLHAISNDPEQVQRAYAGAPAEINHTAAAATPRETTRSC